MENIIRWFKEEGYILLESLISKDECSKYKELLEKSYRDYSSLYAKQPSKQNELANKSGEKTVFNLHNKDLKWFDIFERKEILDILDVVLKEGSYNNNEPYYLNNISARCPLRNHPKQQLHIDGNLPGSNYCLIVNVLWMLDDFTKENGGIRVIPKSHLRMRYAENNKDYPDEQIIEASQGSALIFNANLWHAGGENLTNESRWGVALGYARWFIKPSFDFVKNTPSHIYAQLSSRQKKLLGFHITPPKDEFTRLRRRSTVCAHPDDYKLPYQE